MFFKSLKRFRTIEAFLNENAPKKRMKEVHIDDRFFVKNDRERNFPPKKTAMISFFLIVCQTII